MSEEAAVLEANETFYHAIRAGDLAVMEVLWSTERRVTCTHPGWRMLVGRQAVMQSWQMLLVDQEPPEIWMSDATVIVTGASAMVMCTEQIGRVTLMATNAFVYERGAWRMLNHQAARTAATQDQ